MDQPASANTRRVVWSEDGQGPAGAAPNPNLWEVRVTDQWQPAQELQIYTSAANTCYDGHGHLTITALRGCPGFTSARLHARHPGFLYGRFEASIKIPDGAGAWPAFWLLGPDHQDGWPACGEIDIMEAPASSAERGRLHQGIHCGHTVTASDLAVGVEPSSGIWASDFHTYAADWQPGRIDFLVDGHHTGTVTREQVTAADGEWPFDHKPQRPILNLAIGGWAGPPDDHWTAQTMLIDYVNIHQ